MSAPASAPAATTSLWQGGELVPRDDCDLAPAIVEVADSWLVEEGTVRGLELHRERFLTSIPRSRARDLDLESFWSASIAGIPRHGAWFPRVELREQLGMPQLLFRLREAPALQRSLILTTHTGRDPRTQPTVKGPDLGAMVRLRTEAQRRGADEAVIVDDDGHIVEGSTTCLVWWDGGTLCVPDRTMPRIPSITERTVVALATALSIPIDEQRVRPEELDGREVWALNALHGIRIVTAWQGGPASTAEEPGRLSRWRLRLDALRRPLPEPDGGIGAA
ncbi:aminotransferase class IV [Protaetiibacter mangrovi]|uniref:Aminotransferase class IV n=1 Tax=Protaetiibacter mangrovi TaxID=2970926 RepID=A0ABT1ZEV0_9MICO|nr:aminotransferase class IV [Protaetiibacter mangrovi]MCS0499229.1 aminotransferase class IV [Protaetiibacter mangrovi]